MENSRFEEIAKKCLEELKPTIYELINDKQVKDYYELAKNKDLDSRRIDFEIDIIREYDKRTTTTP